MHRKTMQILTAALAVAFMVSSASGTLLVHEPFAYPDATLNGNGFSLGTTGGWSSTDTGFASGWWTHPSGAPSGQVVGPGGDGTLGTADDDLNVFNGTYSNLHSFGGWAGTAAPGDKGLDPWTDNGSGNLDANIGIAPSVTSTFQSNSTTWFSYVTARAWDRNESSPQVMLTNLASSGGTRGLYLGGNGNRTGEGIGGGGGPSRFNLVDIYPQYFEEGVNNHAPGGFDYPEFPYPANAWNVPGSSRNLGTPGTNDGMQWFFGSGNNTESRGTLLEGTQVWDASEFTPGNDFGDYNVVVMKIEWDADTNGEDIISLVSFLSTDVISEAAFDAAIVARPEMSSANWTGRNEMVTSEVDGLQYQVTYGDNKPDLDQSTLNLINIQGLKFYVDEIRLGTTFTDVAPAPGPGPSCDFEPDGDCDIDDLDALTLVGDLEAGVAVPPADAKFDLNNTSIVDKGDLDSWLHAGAVANGFIGPYRRGDNDLDRDVDISDFNTLATNFDPGGANVNKWSLGDNDGDGDVDITDFNVLASNFLPGGYDAAPAAAAVTADADPGQVDLVVDVETGEVTLDGNNAAISGLQVFSAGNSLLATDFTADVLQFVISTNTSTYAEGAFANMGVDGLISLGMMYDALVDARDVTFEYTMIGQPTVQGRVLYIPEPASLVLMGMGGLLVLRRRRAA